MQGTHRFRISVAVIGLVCLVVASCSKDAEPTQSGPQTGAAGAVTGAAGVTGGTAGTAAAPGGARATGQAGAGTGAGAAGSSVAGSVAATSGSGGSSAAASGGAAGAPGVTAGAGGTGTGGAGGAPMLAAEDLVAAPDGKDAAPGTLAEPTTFTAGLTRVAPGRTLFLRGGSYVYPMQVTIANDNSGEAGKLKTVAPYQTEAPVLDFSSQPYGSDSNPRGFQIEGSYWHILGLTARGSADNGIYVAGKHNIIERCITHGNRDTGLQIGRASSQQAQQADWPSDNLILNCESYDNYDSPPGAGENADGFAAKLTVGTGNVFRGCVSHNNIDDGWDLYTKSDTGAIGPVTIDQCVAHHNGTLTNGTTNGNGDRNGFKLGGEKIAVAHVVTRSVAYQNGKNGFTWNSNPGAIRLSNTLSFDNAEGNYKFGDSSTTTQAVFTNNVSLWLSTGSVQNDKAVGENAGSSNRFWMDSAGSGVAAADFASALGTPLLKRDAMGNLDLSAFALAPGSKLIDAGAMPAGMLPFDAAYYHGKPDLGAVESP